MRYALRSVSNGVMSYDVSQRSKEIGIRMALLLVAAVAAAYVRARRATGLDR